MAAYIEMNGAMNFLIVDPIVPNVEAMKMNLKKMGYRNFVVKPDAFEAINYIKKEKIEFILCRLNLGDVSGTDFMEEIKNDLSIQRIPFMMFSENMDEGDLALLTELGVDAHLTIPFVTKDLAEKVMTTWSRYIDPKNPEFHFEAARRLFLSGKSQEAADAFAKIAASGKLVSRALVAHGRAIAKLGRSEDALKIAQKVRKDYPKFVHGHQFTGELLVELKQDIEALECFFTAISLSPKNPYRYQAITEILMRMERFAETELVLIKAIEAGVDLPFIAENMAQALIKQDKKQEALSWYQKLVDRDPKNSTYHNNIAICYKKLSNIAKALEHYQTAADVAPKDARVRYNLAIALLDSDKKTQGINTLKETLGIDKNHEKAKLKLMELTDPKAYAAEMAKRKAIEDKLKKEEEAKQKKIEAEAKAKALREQSSAEKKAIAEKQKTLESEKRPILSKEDEERLSDLLSKLIKLQAASKVTGSKALTLPLHVESTIKKLQGGTLRFHYGVAAMTLRKQLFKLMNQWFQSINVISEELAVDIGDIVQGVLQSKNFDVSKLDGSLQDGEKAKKLLELAQHATDTDNALKEELMPIIMELQFQDYLRQSLGALQKTFRISYEESDLSIAVSKMEKCLVTVEDKAFVKKFFGIEESQQGSSINASVESDISGGDGLFFDEPVKSEDVSTPAEKVDDASSGDVLLF